ncbi:MAG TPA: response regulator [Opitutaceae bacterium]|nr:response regulator [Opitutaceae bacterium]
MSQPGGKSLAGILLVDDDIRNLDVLESILQSPEYDLVRAVTAEAALRVLLEGEFAAIVLDVQMPEMNGIELANLIKQRKRTQHIPIIFLTAHYQDDSAVLQGYGTGAVDYLTKPLNPQILRSKIAVFVDLFQKTRALAAANAALESEVAHRQKAEEALRHANNDLETRVQERTADLVRLNEELRERETALRASEAEALAASRAKDDFLARLSHELRTPLSPVLLLASEAVSNPDLPERVRADFETIAKSVALEARLIDDLLDLTRIARGKLPLEMHPVDVHSLLKDALLMTEADTAQKGLEIELRLEAPQSMVLGDDVRLKQVFWNVLKNAAKFTPRGGRITVETSATPELTGLNVRIADTGIGLTAEELSRIFHSFSQGDHAAHGSPQQYGGVGLGLAISRMLVELHLGSISATSLGRNQGSTFAIRLPLLRTAGRETPEASGPVLPTARAPQAGSNGHRARVLLVEDHAPTRQVLVHLLSHRAFAIAAAGSVAEALALAAEGRFDVLISDIGLPDGNGYDLMTELRDRHGTVGIALTGFGMEDDVSRSQAAGFVIHLTKPVSVQALDSALSVAATSLQRGATRARL